jgi:hypothetical protein
MPAELPLQSAHLAGGVERVSWWNGRILTAEDMSDHQRATDQADRRLGAAIGAGVVRGLRVTRRPDGRSVSVTAGLAVDPAGEVLELPAGVVVRLVAPLVAAGGPSGADFVVCGDRPASVSSAGTGAYLLTVASAAGSRGTAPGAAVPNLETSACGPRYQVAGVQFRLLALDLAGLATAGGHDEADLAVLASVGSVERHPRLRNVVAHVFLDSVMRAQALLDPFGGPGSYTPALHRLTQAGILSPCEQPLAVVTWARAGIDFVDNHAVRRPPSTASAAWPAAFAGDRATDAGLASLLQFADHLADLAGPSVPAVDRRSLKARAAFRYVPPAALIPLGGVDLGVFLSGLDARGGASMAAGRVWPLIRSSLTAPIVDLDVDGVLRSYTVDEAVDAAAGQPYVVLAADHLRHLAVAPPDDSDRLVIVGVSPPGDHPIRSEITVHGRNFAVPGNRNTVAVAGVRVAEFNPGTGPTALVFNVPEVTGAPRVAPIVVSNDHGDAEWLISVVPRVVVPEGEIEIADDFADLAGQIIDENQTYTFGWQVTAVTDVAGTYRFHPVFTGATGGRESDWAGAAVVVDDTGAERDTFRLAPRDPANPASGPVRVGVKLRVPVGAESVELALRCESPVAPGDPDLNRTSSPVRLVIGEPVPISDSRIVFDAPELTAGGVVAADGALVIPVGRDVRLLLVARFTEAGRFSYAARVEPGRQPVWRLKNPRPAPGIDESETAGGEGRFQVTLQPVAAETDPATVLHVRVTGRPAGGGDDYVSFVRLRLRTG